MKRTLIITAAFAVLAVAAASAYVPIKRFNSMSEKTDKQGHYLTTLWKDYYKADEADLPQKAAVILEEIVRVAEKKELAWDFYDGYKKLYEVTVRRNWKNRSSILSKIEEADKRFDVPIVTFRLMRSSLLPVTEDGYAKILSESSDRLKRSRNVQFYSADGFPKFLTESLSNDYEYVLWSILYSGRYLQGREQYADELAEYLDGNYPNGVFLEYIIASMSRDNKQREDLLKAFAEKYQDKAISLFARQDLLEGRMSRMDEKASSEDYLALRKDCEDFERTRKSYSASEAEIAGECTQIEELIEQLDSKELSVECNDDVIYVIFRNVGNADIEVRKGSEKGRVIMKKSVVNQTGSYYLNDTEKLSFPKSDDGKYYISCKSGKINGECDYSRNTISVAYHTGKDGMVNIYAADYKSGKPIEKASLILSRDGSEMRIDGFFFNGFTPIGSEAYRFLSSGRMASLKLSYFDSDGYLRKSNDVFIRKYLDEDTADEDVAQVEEEDLSAHLLTDRAAYNPGDMVKFKSVLYNVSADGRKINVAENTSAVAVFIDSEGNEIESRELVTNDFGSCAGEFVIPSSRRNGRYNIEIRSMSGEEIGYAYFVVDEFVLPTYTIEFEKPAVVCLPGEEIVLKGRVKSYSGHSLSSASAVYVKSTGEKSEEGSLELSSDGSFEIGIKADEDDDYCYVTVKVTDLTGETSEASEQLYTGADFRVLAELRDPAEGLFTSDRNNERWVYRSYNPVSLMKGIVADIDLEVLDYNGNNLPATVSYELSCGENTILSGKIASTEPLKFDLSEYASGLYKLDIKAIAQSVNGSDIVEETQLLFVKTSVTDKAIGFEAENFFKKIESDRITLQYGTSEGPLWAVVELYGDGNVLRSEIVSLDGKASEEGSVGLVDYEYESDYPDAVLLQVFYFRGGRNYSYSEEYSRPRQSEELPLSFTAFTDKSVPGQECFFTLKTDADAECLVSVFDASSENIMRNVWRTIMRRQYTAEGRFISVNNGDASTHVLIAYGLRSNLRSAQKNMMAVTEYDMAETESAMEENYGIEAASGAVSDVDVPIRSRFDKTLAFLPFLRSDDDGNIGFSFRASDKLSAFVVQVYAHDKEMRNNVLRKEMTVTMPVKVSVVEPAFLFEGDKYVLKASVSNASETDVEGVLTLYIYDNENYSESSPILVTSKRISVEKGDAAARDFDVEVPCCDKLGFKVVFRSESDGIEYSDGVFVSLPVLKPVQTITESHSALWLAGSDKDSLIASLRSRFEGVSAEDASWNEITIMDMLLNSLHSKTEPSSDNILSLTEAYYVNSVSRQLKEDYAVDGKGAVGGDDSLSQDMEGILKKISDCRNADGGFGWFAGMKSSPIITAVVLERLAYLSSRGLGEDLEVLKVDECVRYLDRSVSESYGRFCPWCGNLSFEQYLYVRSKFVSVPYDDGGTKSGIQAFKKEIKSYLLPQGARGLEGCILPKARRAATAFNLSTPDGIALLSSMGLKGVSLAKLKKSAEADILSLTEYAVEHPSGGVYYPNAVMPFRGLLESEAYAHSLLCDMFATSGTERAASIADGLRLWLMVQKETQKWEDDPAYINAVASVLDGSDDVKSTSVIVMAKTYTKPFEEIKAAGNGFTVSRKFYRYNPNAKDGMEALSEGDTLSVGDKLLSVIEIWNEENRSFVRIEAPRYASLRPVNYLSGHYGWWARPLSVVNGYWITPQGYMEVKSDRTIWYFDVYPEENTKISEEFYVTQSGVFTSPVTSIESLYAPHYRANDRFFGKLFAE